MHSAGRTAWLTALLAAVVVLLGGGGRRAAAQFGPLPDFARFELAETVQLNRADSTVMGDLERVKAHLDARQWDEAVETLRRVLENSEEKLVGVTERRYVSLRDYCHLQLANLPAEALKLYRSRVDPVARRWYDEGIQKRDRRLLANVLEKAFASSWGDDALMALGEIALEQGDYTSARWYCERIIPAKPPPDAPQTWPGFPDTDLDLAAVRARLVLVSILEGSPVRARDELAQFVRLHPDAQGRLGGREVKYAEALGAMIAESGAWPRPKTSPDWPTFAGCTKRNKIASEMIDVGKVVWRMPLRAALTLDGFPTRSGIEVKRATLSYHPVYAEGLVLVNDSLEIKAIDVQTGRPPWGEAGSAVYRDQLEDEPGAFLQRQAGLGTPQFTMTVFDGKLYVRMGSTVTNWPQAEAGLLPGGAIPRGYLVCLDLAAEGRLMWKITPEPGWAFEGSPVADGASVYVGMRCGGLPEAHVACFDARTGRRRWRVFVCGAETPARGMFPQHTHNLLTLQRRTLYYNTNLGAVAAISARDGRIRWVSLYPRARDGNLQKPAPHWQRDLNPCLYDHGTVLVAPADSPRILALDAATGQILWQTEPPDAVRDVIHLLGTTGEHLIAGGQKLYWIGLNGEDRGRVKHVWPDGPEKPGYGRGVLAGDSVLWPTREKIYVFDQKTARPKKVIDLVPRGVSGGNLLAADGHLLIATAGELIALGPQGGVPKKDPDGVAADQITISSRQGRSPTLSTSTYPIGISQERASDIHP